ncbi:hypothetical protein ACFQGT_05930 [Natrialbaceae archaeon GCM10025810]|uniref:hypothetical protein n=1 Tax=Halovalidus salilacus TaxID=3075124 RepID=UPI00361D3829
MSDGESATEFDVDLESLLDGADESLERLEERLGGVERLEELEGSELESLLGDVDDLVRLASAVEELLEAIDLSDLPDAVDGDEVLEAIEVGEIPDALGDGDADAGVGDAVDFGKLFGAVDLLNAWDATDLRDLWEAKGAVEDAVDDAAGDGEDDALVEKAASAVAGEDGLTGDDGLVGGADGLAGEDGIVGGEGDLIDGEALDLDLEASDAFGEIDIEEDPEAYQVFIQQQAMKGIDAFREALLLTHEKFEKLYEFNRERMRRTDRGTNSRNPTAKSTVPIDRRDLGGGARYSTVPRDVKLSTAPSRTRIYGRRFELERERLRGEGNTND